MMRKFGAFSRRPGGGGEPEIKSWGEQVVNSDEYKALAKARSGKARIEVKTTITSAVGSGGALTQNQHVMGDGLIGRRKLRMRDIITSGRTNSGSIEFPRQSLRTTAAAAAVAEAAAKPESAYTWDLVTAPVRTLAHFVPASKQIFEDAPMLQSLTDGELCYGLGDVEDRLAIIRSFITPLRSQRK